MVQNLLEGYRISILKPILNPNIEPNNEPNIEPNIEPDIATLGSNLDSESKLSSDESHSDL